MNQIQGGKNTITNGSNNKVEGGLNTITGSGNKVKGN